MAVLVNEWLSRDEIGSLFDRAQKRGDALLVVFAAAQKRHIINAGTPSVSETIVREYGAALGAGADQIATLKHAMACGSTPSVRAVYDCTRAFEAARGGKELLAPETQAWLAREAQVQHDVAQGEGWWKRILRFAF